MGVLVASVFVFSIAMVEEPTKENFIFKALGDLRLSGQAPGRQ
jgi:hypothetical protein